MLRDLDLQICASSETPSAGNDWLHQVKHDGWRLLLRVSDELRLRITSRNGKDYTDEFALPAKGLTEFGRPLIIDTEVAVPDENGVTHLDRLHEARRRNRPDLFAFLAFDLVYLDGSDLRRCPVEERMALLEELIEDAGCPRLKCAGYQIGRGPELFAAAKEAGAEGIVRKRLGQTLCPRREPALAEDEAVQTGRSSSTELGKLRI